MEASRRAAALAAKDAGNALFKSGDWRGAAAAYTEAIALDAGDRAFYSNRSAARLSLGDAAGALADADAATALDGGWPKAHYRRGLALRGTGDLRGAVLALERGLAALPGAPCPKWAHAAKFREALATVLEARLAAAAAREGGGGRAVCQPVEPPLSKWN
jgi:tetratricopeptide (TPR) repeat protein